MTDTRNNSTLMFSLAYDKVRALWQLAGYIQGEDGLEYDVIAEGDYLDIVDYMEAIAVSPEFQQNIDSIVE